MRPNKLIKKTGYSKKVVKIKKTIRDEWPFSVIYFL